MFKAQRLVYHSTLGSRVAKKKKRVWFAAAATADVPSKRFRV